MTPLFLSLLRAGDFIMQVPLIRKLAGSHKAHVVINDEFKQLANLYPEFEFYFFPRREIQKIINQAETSLLVPYDILQQFFFNLNQKQWTEVYNLTHTRLSAYFMNCIPASKKMGLQYEEGIILPFQNSWQEFFNVSFSENRPSDYHYLTALSKAMECDSPMVKTSEKRQSRKILFQTLTSDVKKNWPLEKWAELYRRFRIARPQYEISVLCAPHEKASLQNFFPEEILFACDLTGARHALRSAELLITGDTSVAHLAAEVRAPMVVVSLGSSDLTKTAPWQHGTIVLSSATSCSPCAHSSQCPYPTTLCGEQLMVRTVLSAALAQLEDRFDLSIAEPEFAYRMQMTFKNGLKPVDISLSRRKDGIIEEDIKLL